MTFDVPVIDAHVHQWDPRTTPRKASPLVKLLGWSKPLMHGVARRLFPRAIVNFIGLPDYVLAPYLPKDWQRDHEGVNVRGFVHIQVGWNRPDLSEETRWLESLCGPELLAIVGEAHLDAPDLAKLLDDHRAASPRFVGVRDITAHDPDRGVEKWTAADRMKQPAWRRGLALLGERDLSFDAWVYHPQLQDLTAAVREAPKTRVVLCHLGTPIGFGGPYAGFGKDEAARAGIATRWRDDLARLAELPNVHAKLSGLTMPILGFGFHTRPEPPGVAELVERLGPLVEHALACFGPERCFFASNFPMDKVSVPWPTLFAALAELVASRDAETRRRLFHDNAARFYGVV